MQVHTYRTLGGKDVILAFINSLSLEEKIEGLSILEKLEQGSKSVLDSLDIKHFEGKIWEIKFRKFNRIFYILKEEDNIYLLHACKKQKNAAESLDKNLVKKRAKEIK